MNRLHPSQEIVIQTTAITRVTDVASQMLANAGYQIVPVGSCEEAFQRASNGLTEMLILDGPHHEISSALDRLATLPAAQRPNHVAVLRDEAGGDDDTLLNRSMSGTKVHLFFTPLQAYGLLKVIRGIRRQVTQTAN